jgi:DNA-binding NarL/FixJ family response regulator
MTGQRAATRVLVVDDHLMFAELLGEVLHDHDDIVVTAYVTTGDEAVDAARRDAPDVVVLDYLLPGEDGVAVAARLRCVAPEIGIVMLTGLDDDTVLSAALLAGCTGFVTKDRATRELVEAVRAVRDGRGAIDPGAIARLATMRHDATAGHATGLTQREQEVLALLAEGSTTREIASRLFISLNTTRNHVQRLIAKLGAHSRLEAVAAARRAGLLETAPH